MRALWLQQCFIIEATQLQLSLSLTKTRKKLNGDRYVGIARRKKTSTTQITFFSQPGPLMSEDKPALTGLKLFNVCVSGSVNATILWNEQTTQNLTCSWVLLLVLIGSSMFFWDVIDHNKAAKVVFYPSFFFWLRRYQIDFSRVAGSFEKSLEGAGIEPRTSWSKTDSDKH